MSKSKKRRKIVVFSAIILVIAGLSAVAIFRKREVVITVQTEKVVRTNLIEKIIGNGKIQPVVQVKISPEVSGEIIELPVKEGQHVNKGDLILKIKPDFYIASRNQAQAGYESSLAGQATAEANLRKAEAEYKRNWDLFKSKLISDSTFDEVKAAFDIAQAQLNSAFHQVESARASLASTEDALAKTTMVSPLTGTVSKLNSEVGERVVGTATMAGTEIMTIADLNEMEARVDIGEMDVVLIAPCQPVHLEVDAFKDQKFNGSVTEIANSSRNAGMMGGSSQEATKFEVRIRIKEKESFRPGMSVTAEVETRARNSVIAVPIASVTTRMPKDKDKDKKNGTKLAALASSSTNSAASKTNLAAVKTNAPAITPEIAETKTNSAGTNTTVAADDKKSKEGPKPIEVVFVLVGDHVKMVPVKLGISDDARWEITEGLKEGDEVVSGGYKAISRELEDGKKVRKGTVTADQEKEEKKG